MNFRSSAIYFTIMLATAGAVTRAQILEARGLAMIGKPACARC